MKAVFRGYYVSLIIFLLAILFFYFLGEISSKVLSVVLCFRILLFAVPVIGGFYAGWLSEKSQGFSSGVLTGILIYITVILFLVWFSPLLLELRPLLSALFYCLSVPTLAGGFAYNLRLLKPATFDNK